MLGWFLPYISVKRPYILMGLPGGAAGKESTCNVGDLGSIPGFGRSPGGGNGYPLQYSWAFPGGSAGKESTCTAGDPGLIPGLGRSPEKENGYRLQYSGLENSMDSPWNRKELDMTKRHPVPSLHGK